MAMDGKVYRYEYMGEEVTVIDYVWSEEEKKKTWVAEVVWECDFVCVSKDVECSTSSLR